MKVTLILLIPLLGIFIFFSACEKDTPPLPQTTKTFMLAIISPPNEVPFDFEAASTNGEVIIESGEVENAVILL